MANARKPADLVLEGGGVKGIGLVGALSELDKAGYRFGRSAGTRVAGTSAGAVAGALVAAGMPIEQIREVMYNLDYRNFRDKSTIGRLPIVGDGYDLLFEKGVYEGDFLRTWLRDQLKELGVETFADLELVDPPSWMEPDQQYSLVVMATDVTTGQLVRLPWDYRMYGLDPGRQRVADAVRASMSIPFVYKPVTMTNPRTKQSSTLVDGGVLSNFPIDALDRLDGKPPRWPTFGVKLLPALPHDDKLMLPHSLRALLGAPVMPAAGLLESVLTTAIVGNDQTRLKQPWAAARTIRVDTNSVGVTDFDLTDEQKRLLFDNGRKAARAFIRDWDFKDYLARYRR